MSLVLTDEQLKDLLDTSKPRPTKDFKLDDLAIGQLRKLAGEISNLKIKQAEMKAMGKDQLIGEIRKRIPNIEARIEEGEFAAVGVPKDRKLENLNVAALRKLVTKYNKDIAIPKYKSLKKEELIAEIRKRFPMLEFKPDVRQPLRTDEEVITPTPEKTFTEEVRELPDAEYEERIKAAFEKAGRRRRLEKIYENYGRQEGPQALRQLKRRTSDSILEEYGGSEMETKERPIPPGNQRRKKKRGRPRKEQESNIVEAIIDDFNERQREEENTLKVIEVEYRGKTYYVDVKTNDVYDPETEDKVALTYDPKTESIVGSLGKDPSPSPEPETYENTSTEIEYKFLAKGDPGVFKKPRNEEEEQVYSMAELNIPTYQNNLAALRIYEDEILPRTMEVPEDYEPSLVDGQLDRSDIPGYSSVNADINQDALTLLDLAEMTPNPFMRNLVLQAGGQDDPEPEPVYLAPHDEFLTMEGNFRDEDGDIDEDEIPYQIVYTLLDSETIYNRAEVEYRGEEARVKHLEEEFSEEELRMLYVAGYQRKQVMDNPLDYQSSIINPVMKDGVPFNIIPIGRIYYGGKKEYDDSLNKDVYEYQAFTLSSREPEEIETKEMIPEDIGEVIDTADLRV